MVEISKCKRIDIPQSGSDTNSKAKDNYFPYNCILKIQCTHVIGGEIKPPYYGVGSLIANNLVITSAHLIFRAEGNRRFKAVKIEVFYQNKIIEATYCSNFPNHSYAREHDYALLRLRDNIYIENYLFIVKDYEALENISLLTIGEDNNKQRIVRIVTDKNPVAINNKRILVHNLET